MTQLYYKFYETVFKSEIEILNLPKVNKFTDFAGEIILSSKPSSYIPKGQFGVYYSPNVGALGSDWGTMEVCEGNLIKIHLYEGHTAHEASPFIIGFGFAFLFNQRGYSIFHCSALNINGRGVMISGVSGAGKSSTALALINNGAKYLVDDMAVVSSDDLDLIPSYPIQKVCRDVSIDLKQEDLMHINEGRDKFAYHNETDFYDGRLKINTVVLLGIHDGDELEIIEHQGINKWMKVLECLYLNEQFLFYGTPDKDKKNCLKIAEGARVIEISRPRGKDTLAQITEIITEFANK